MLTGLLGDNPGDHLVCCDGRTHDDTETAHATRKLADTYQKDTRCLF
jgi:hypothetical protein